MRIHSGLGNQMFQYAAGRHLASLAGSALALDVFSFGRDQTFRYELGHFRIAGEIIATSGTRRTLERTAQPLHRLGISIGSRWATDTFWPNPLDLLNDLRADFRYPSWFESLPSPVYLSGYWQSERFFESSSTHIRSDFTFANATGAEKAADELRRRDDVVSMHVRRGDALDNPVLAQPGLSYYRRAMESFGSGYEFLIFSDDPDWCEQNFDCSAVRVVSGNTAIQDMQLMSACAHNIISNSTFSWWAAWLNERPDRRVVAPTQWFSPHLAPDVGADIVPSSWTRI